jgi:hypothetical protein
VLNHIQTANWQLTARQMRIPAQHSSEHTERLDSVFETRLDSDLRRWPSSMICADQENLRSCLWSCA